MGKLKNIFWLWVITLLPLVFSFFASQVPRTVFAGNPPRIFIDASSNNFPPINMLDSDGHLTGFGPDLADAVVKEVGGKIKHIHSQYWSQVLAWLAAGKADFIHDTGYTPERANFLDYSDPIIEMPEVIFVRTGQWDVTDLKSLKGKTIACVYKHITHIYLSNLPGIKCHIVKTPVEGIYSLVAGEVDAFVYPKQIALYLIQKLRLQDKIKIAGDPLRILTWCMVVKKGNKEMLMLLNQGLRRVKASGEYRRIYDKWWGKKLFAGYSRNEVVVIAAMVGCATLLAVLSLGLLAYNRSLKRGKHLLEVEIEQRKRVEEQRMQLEAQLRQTQKLEAIGTLAEGIAHDFNNILAVVIGYTELTKDDLPSDHPAQKNLEQISKTGNRARDLVRQIMRFGQLTEEHKQPVNLASILKEELTLLRSVIPATIEIKQNIADSQQAMVLADASQMNQIFMNLCNNAAQAMGEGGVLEVSLDKVSLDTGASRIHPDLKPGYYNRLMIKDTGEGIAQQHLERIFDPFFTTKEVGKGTGMGLSVVHGIVQAHGGAITVESELGKGSAFKVYLPLWEGAALMDEEVDGDTTLGDGYILMVDDEPPLVDIGRKVLERLGYRVTALTSSVQALEIFRADPDLFDLVITDYTMPGLTGLGLAQELRRIKPGIPIIISTGLSERVTPERAQEVGINRVVCKPLNTRETARVVAEVLRENKSS